MFVQCQACRAKYSVPDDKVGGKKIRITCKHCGSPIIIDCLRPGEVPQRTGGRPPACSASARGRTWWGNQHNTSS